jgi:predicted nucleic acid-binding protein
MRNRDAVFFFDTVVLSNFALAGRFGLLVTRYGPRAIITPEVRDEITDGVVAGYSRLCEVEDAVDSGAVGCAGSLSAAERRVYRELLRVLGPGEASCIAHAKARKGIVVTDDRTARECCVERGMAFTGTLGVLKSCCGDGTLTVEDADAILQSMIKAGFYSPVQTIYDLP